MPSSRTRLTIEGRDWPVRVVRHPTARRVTLRVEPWEDAVRLTLPRRACLTDALDWAAGQEAALVVAAARRAVARPFRAGGSVPLEGVERRIVRDGARGVTLGQDIRVGGDEAGLSARLHRALKAHARDVLDRDTRALAEAHGLTVRSVGVGDPASRWGSCAVDGRLRYSWRLILMPPWVRQMIVAHEVAHLRHPHHQPMFHVEHRRLLGAPPDPATAWLKANGRRLHGVGREPVAR